MSNGYCFEDLVLRREIVVMILGSPEMVEPEELTRYEDELEAIDRELMVFQAAG